MPDTVKISLCLLCTIKQEKERRWVAGCPSLDIFSQGETEEEAKHCLKEAVELWVEDCLERDALEAALQEAGFHKIHPDSIRPGAEHILIGRSNEQPEAIGTFPVEVTIPAYQAAALLSASR